MPPALSLDLLTAVVASGAAPRSAVLALAEALESAGQSGSALRRAAEDLLGGPASDQRSVVVRPAAAGSGDSEVNDALLGAVTGALFLSTRSGLPPAELLRAAAVRARSRQSMQARAAIRRLEVLLVIPAGICLLPAFVLLGVAPVVLALFRG
jgi:hypothetical protein